MVLVYVSGLVTIDAHVIIISTIVINPHTCLFPVDVDNYFVEYITVS